MYFRILIMISLLFCSFVMDRVILQGWPLWTIWCVCSVKCLLPLKVETSRTFLWGIGDFSSMAMLRPSNLIKASLQFYCITLVSGNSCYCFVSFCFQNIFFFRLLFLWLQWNNRGNLTVKTSNKQWKSLYIFYSSNVLN